MPANKKRNKGRGSFRSKQRRLERRGQEPAINESRTINAAGRTTPAAAAPAPVAPAAVPRPAPGPRIAPVKFNYPDIVGEIRSIAILFVVVLVMLVTLSLLLR